MKFTIIGAGIGGLATALAFEKAGIDYEVYEKVPVFKEVGAGIWLAANALQVFDFLGILEHIKEKGNAVDRFTIGKPNLTPIADNIQSEVKEKYGFSTIAIHRSDLQSILINSIPKEKIFFGKEFKSYDAKSNSVVVSFMDDSSIETDFVIGADGINSKVRKQLFPESKTRYSGQTCWRGVSDFSLVGDLKNRAFELWGNQIRFGFSSISPQKVYWFAVALSKRNGVDDKRIIKNQLLDRYASFDPLVSQIISSTKTEKISRNDIDDLIPLASWYNKNICLIGDAAHATTPNMGQGGGQAIEDAYYLSNIILRNSDKGFFQLFYDKRKHKVNQIVKNSWSTGKMAHIKYGQSIRNFLLKNMPQKLMKKQMQSILEIEKFS